MITIACVACLDPAISVHTPGFLRAVALARALALPAGVRVDLYDDRASAEGGASAAQRIVADRPDVVVGHFASAAARAAAPLYARAGLPLILPAATRTDLTRHRGVFRVCDNDRDYVDWLCDAIGRPIHAALSDGSAHGDSVVQRVRNAACFTPAEPADTVLLSGLYRPVVALAARTRARCLILTDDADTPSLAADLAAAGLDLDRTEVLIGALHRTPQGALARRILKAEPAPGAYFWETIAALQVAAAHPRGTEATDTVLGPMRFDPRGEARPRAFALRRVTPARTATAA